MHDTLISKDLTVKDPKMTSLRSGMCMLKGVTPKELSQVNLNEVFPAPAVNGPSVEKINSVTSFPSAVSGSNDSVSDCDYKIFVGGLNWQTTPEILLDYFSQFGSVTNAFITKDRVTQRSRGFGFVTFKETKTVSSVLAVPVHMLDGRPIQPKHANPRLTSGSGSYKTRKIFVGGVSKETSAEDMKGYFSQFGKVEAATMLMDKLTNRHRGFGFVTFHSVDVVDDICGIHFHTIKGKRVECEKANLKPSTWNLPKQMVLPHAAASMVTTQAMHGLYPPSVNGGVPMPMASAVAASYYSKLLGDGLQYQYPSTGMTGNYRYTPYQLPHFNGVNWNAMRSLSFSATQEFGAYTLPPSLDISSLQNLFWSGAYNYNPFL